MKRQTSTRGDLGLPLGVAILTLLSCVASAAAVEQTPPPALSVSAYITELDRLLEATQTLDDHPQTASELARALPAVWRVQTDQRTFDVPADWLRRDLVAWRAKRLPASLIRIAEGLQVRRAEAASLQEPLADIAAARGRLTRILADREFLGLHGPTWIDRLEQRVAEFFFQLLGRLFRASAIPTIGRVLVDALIGLAVLLLFFWMYRSLRSPAPIDPRFFGPLPVSARPWTAWLAEAHVAADSGNWRSAVRLAYWCSISFLEGQGVWPPDRARTPREYLRLLPSSSAHVPTLTAFTRSCELVWYGTGDADAHTFAEALGYLKKLGCPST